MSIVNKNYIIAFWHGRQLMLVYTHRNRNIYVLVSRSFDGELISRILEKFGSCTVRGSSSREGKQALNKSVNLLLTGHIAAFTPDGPRGPAGTVAPGVIVAAAKSGKPILPLAVGAKSKLHLRSWDSFMIPYPFTEIVIAYGTPLHVPNDLSADSIDKCGKLLKTELDRITHLADSYF